MRRVGLMILRQAGSAGALVPSANTLAGKSRPDAMEPLADALDAVGGGGADWEIRIIAFAQAQRTCRELLGTGLPISVRDVVDESQARAWLTNNLEGADWILTGTSEQAEDDAWFWRRARQAGVLSIAYLDQGINIENRFPGPAASDWPDWLAVIDVHDASLVRALAPSSLRILVTGSPALQNIRHLVADLRAAGCRPDPGLAVFVTEPVNDPEAFRNEHGFNDEDSFALALRLLRAHHAGVRLVMRLHPRDSRARWEARLPRDIPVEWDERSRADCIAQAGVIFGMRSFFLVEAAAAGAAVYSLQPQRKTTSAVVDPRMPVITDAAAYIPPNQT